MRRLVILAALALSGCAHFTNEAYCSGERMVFVSWYYGVGIAARVSNGAEHCKKAGPAGAPSKPAA